MKEISNKIILVFALPRHDGAYASTSFSLASELSSSTRVYYIENPFTIIDFIRDFFHTSIKKRRKLFFFQDIFFPTKEKNLFVVTPRLVLPINWLPKGRIYNFFSKINNRIVYKTIKGVLSRESDSEYIFINSFNPLFGTQFPASFSPSISIYHCVDDISQSAYISRHGSYLEEEVVSNADLTIVTSSELKKLKSIWSKRVVLLPNAANTRLFQQALQQPEVIPKEIRELAGDRPIICYIGNVCHRIDYLLLSKIAVDHGDKIILMIGPITGDLHARFDLESHKNVIFVGRKDITELPKYLAFSGCSIIPFKKNKLTRSIYPLKINEYLSAGKPVVSTSFSEDVAAFSEVAYLAENPVEFSSMIKIAFDEDSEELIRKRVTFSSQNDWKNRAEEFWTIIKNYEIEKRIA